MAGLLDVSTTGLHQHKEKADRRRPEMLPAKPLIRLRDVSRSEGRRGFTAADRAGGGGPGEPQRATPFPTVGAARTPKFNAQNQHTSSVQQAGNARVEAGKGQPF